MRIHYELFAVTLPILTPKSQQRRTAQRTDGTPYNLFCYVFIAYKTAVSFFPGFCKMENRNASQFLGFD